MSNFVAENWDYNNKHVDSSISQDKFFGASRSVIYTAPRNLNGTQSTFSAVGVVQGYQWSENRPVELVFELGSDIPYLVPGRAMGSISLSRILIFGKDLVNSIYNDGNIDFSSSRWIRSLKDIAVPFDLMLAIYSQDASSVYSRVFTNALIEARSESISAGQILLSENVQIRYESIASASLA